MKILGKIVIGLCIFLIGVGIGYYLDFGNSQKNASISYVNASLYDLNIEMDILEHWNSTYRNDKILEKKITHLILNKIVAMSIIEPDISRLKGIPLEALYRLLIYQKKNDKFLKMNNSASNIATKYLSRIKIEVNDLYKREQEIHKKPFNKKMAGSLLLLNS